MVRNTKPAAKLCLDDVDDLFRKLSIYSKTSDENDYDGEEDHQEESKCGDTMVRVHMDA
jgi:hypothetical protein